MRWLDPALPDSPDHPALIAAAKAAVAASPGDMAALLALGDRQFEARAFADARTSYAAVLKDDPGGFDRWERLAEANLWARDLSQAFLACERGLRQSETGALRFMIGATYRELGFHDKAATEFRRALDLGYKPHNPLRALLRPLGEQGDPAALLAFCDGLEARHQSNALVLAYRAAALSQLGRTQEAQALVDLDRFVHWAPLDVPAGYRDMAEFNRVLAAEILANPPAETSDPRVAINHSPQIGPALAALRLSVCAAMEDYLARFDAIGLATALPPPPPAATMRVGTTVLHGDGSNKQHVHPTGYLSSVYYVHVPESVRSANDDRGSLQIGPCDQRTRGHVACWGERLIKPVEGWIAIFPSHLFHDVIPSRTEERRISVPMDLEPVWDFVEQ